MLACSQWLIYSNLKPFIKVNYHALTHVLPPSNARLGMRIYNGTTIANSTHYNTVTANLSSWLVTPPSTPPGFPASMNLDIAEKQLGEAIWQGTALETSVSLASGAGTITWQDSGTDWRQAASWDNSGGGDAPPGTADIAEFGADATITNQPDLNGTTQSFSAFTMDNSQDSYTVSNGGIIVGTDGATVTGSGTGTLDVNVTLNGDQEWNVGAGGTLRYSNASNAFDFGDSTLTKSGDGILSLNETIYINIGAATDVLVTGGTLRLEADPGTTNFAVDLETATLSILGTTLTINRVAGHNGTLEVNSTLNGVITGAGDITLKKVGSGTATIASTISGTGDVTVDDAGDTIRFTANNSYSGTTTVTNGTLLIDGNQGGASGNVNVANGARLGGDGTVGGVTTMAAGSQLAPGTNGTVGSLAFVNGLDASDATWLIDLAGISGDVVDVTGNLNISGSTLNVNGTSGGPIVIATYSGTLNGTFVFDNLPAGWTVDYNYMGLSQIALVPEPGTVIPMVAMLTPWIMRRRRRKTV